ncbi:MAG: UDP-3-O-(3-hydroxymyristoyl)glucosamine N-acyltransferase [Sedimentisphaerales bacterium]|nr:UDP-3-O-(3-hydroxymyristoyl)glucosamine N-acyltransferase [Sedimentisphaerales bacterium]
MKLSELSEKIGARLVGDAQLTIETIASLSEAAPGTLTFANDPQYFPQVEQTAATAVIVPQDFPGKSPAALLFTADVDDALDQALLLFTPDNTLTIGSIDKSACIDPSADIGKNVNIASHVTIGKNSIIGESSTIHPGCVIGNHVKIGANCQLGANVVINNNCVLGNNVIIHANATMGTDGFGYRLVNGKHKKIPHIGIVVIEDDVEIGANTCIDRAKFGKTVIGRGTKIDNLVQIGHNVQVGENCIIVSQAGIAGSCRLGQYVVLGGQVGLKDHIEIGDRCQVGGQCGVMSNVEPDSIIAGSPHRPAKTLFREISYVQKLPDLARQIKMLTKQIESLEKYSKNGNGK